jgi:hypothetical protein
MSKEASRGKQEGNFKSARALKQLFRKETERCKTIYVVF